MSLMELKSKYQHVWLLLRLPCLFQLLGLLHSSAHPLSVYPPTCQPFLAKNKSPAWW